MTNEKKTALLWGPISSFTGPLTAWLITKGWHVDIACKSSLNLLSMSPLDLKSHAQTLIERSFQSRKKALAFSDKFNFQEQTSKNKKSKEKVYDAIIFAGLPPNFDESRGPRAPWSANELDELLKAHPDSELIVISSIYAAVQEDGVVPEDASCERRKPLTNWENTCQQYETKILEILDEKEYRFSLVRLPLICGATDDGSTIKHNGLYSLFKAINQFAKSEEEENEVTLNFAPDATLWYLPIDTAVYIFWRFLEDGRRPELLNMVATNPSLNREWLEHLVSVFEIDQIVASENENILLPQQITSLLTDNVQVSSKNLFGAAGRYHIPPFIADKNYFQKIIDQSQAFLNETKPTGKEKIKKTINSDKLIALYFEEFLPTVLNTDGVLDKAILKGKEIGFKVKEASEGTWILKCLDGESIAQKISEEDKLPSICFKLSGPTLLKLLEKKVPFHRALLLREVEVVGNPIKIMKIVRLLEKSFNENTLSKERLEEVIV